jgi:beta-N-acetylhexosaminidase
VLLEDHCVGACYIANDNVPTPEDAYELVQALQGYAAKTRLKIPLILGVDQEGSWGVMVPGSCTGPGNMALGATHLPEDAYRMYHVLGSELSAVGLNTLLAPCADCNSNPDNSVIGMRSFGEPAALVGAMAAAAARGAHDGGVITTLKHFPGHGDTTLDSHRGIPHVNRTREELFAIDLHPFIEGIKAGVDVVMTSHIIFSALDEKNPATLSRAILTDLLRGEMGFEGVIMSDSMNMQVMVKHYKPEDSAVQGFNAGVDLMMLAEEHYNHNAGTYLQQQQRLIAAVKTAVDNGALPIKRVDDAVRRVLTLKAKYNLTAQAPNYQDIVGSAANRQVELEVSRHAVAVLRDDAKHIPVAKSRPLVLVNTTVRTSYVGIAETRGIGPNQAVAAYDYFAEAMQKKRGQTRLVTAEEVLAGKFIADSNELVIAVTENFPLPGMDFEQGSQPEVIKRLLAIAPNRVVVVALRDPYELRYLPDVRSYVCAFSFRPLAAQAAADVLCGDVPAHGKSPVSVPNSEVVA